jgi:glucosamine--fructose-6-phosphate aminotransferase (isomerizing)
MSRGLARDDDERCARIGRSGRGAAHEEGPPGGGRKDDATVAAGTRPCDRRTTRETLMCGIIGYVGDRDASFILVQGLKRLEYRGYDSAGIATFQNGEITIRRCLGKLENLEKLLREAPVTGSVGIGHTRWATHGRPSEQNAHPHRAGKIVVIHNGIIENYLDLRAALQSRGRTFSSETDTEVISHLIDEHVQKGESLLRATRAVVQQLEGSFSIVVMHEDSPDRLVAAKSATPIVIGLGENENFVASDIPAILDHTRRILFLEDGEIAEVTRERVVVSTFAGDPVAREPRVVAWDPVTAQKGGYRHFLLKEIHEQPQAIIDTMRGRILLEKADVDLDELEGADWLTKARRFTFVACGTAWHACLVGKYFIEHIARIPAEVDYGSEFRSRDGDGRWDGAGGDLASGGTADTLARSTARTSGAKVSPSARVVDSSKPARPTRSSTPTRVRRSRSRAPRHSRPSSRCSICSGFIWHAGAASAPTLPRARSSATSSTCPRTSKSA